MGRPRKVQVEEVPAVNEAELPVVIVKLALPQELYAEYKGLADKQELTASELMVHRLTRCVGHSSIRSLYFPTSQLQQLEALLQKRPLETSDQVVAHLKNLVSFQVGDLPPVPITPQQAKRLHLGTIRGQSVHDRLCYVVQGAIAKATGA